MNYYLIDLDDKKEFNLSYKNLKSEYIRFKDMSNEEFLSNINKAIHLATVISWFKELPNDMTISDIGIIHELIHLLDMPNEPIIDISCIRYKFNNYLKLD